MLLLCITLVISTLHVLIYSNTKQSATTAVTNTSYQLTYAHITELNCIKYAQHINNDIIQCRNEHNPYIHMNVLYDDDVTVDMVTTQISRKNEHL